LCPFTSHDEPSGKAVGSLKEKKEANAPPNRGYCPLWDGKDPFMRVGLKSTSQYNLDTGQDRFQPRAVDPAHCLAENGLVQSKDLRNIGIRGQARLGALREISN